IARVRRDSNRDAYALTPPAGLHSIADQIEQRAPHHLRIQSYGHRIGGKLPLQSRLRIAFALEPQALKRGELHLGLQVSEKLAQWHRLPFALRQPRELGELLNEPS